jgi:hypothetical protein
MGKILECKGCAKVMQPMDQFPGGVCVDCWEKAQENEPMPTAQDLVRMRGGK